MFFLMAQRNASDPKPKRASNSATRQAQLNVCTRVLRIRIKDKHAAMLLAQSKEVNMVWNYCQDLSLQVLRREGRFMSAYDMADFTKGAGKEGLSLHSQTIQGIAEEYCTRRLQFKKSKLRWRVSRGSKRSLGWVPVKASALSYRAGQLRYQGQAISLWDSFGLSDYTLRSGSFSEDARGRWHLNVAVDVKKAEPICGATSLGIDLGLKDFMVDSDGSAIDARKFYRELEPALAKAQRAGKKDRARSIHAKIGNRRKDFLHKLSSELVKKHGAIFVGNVNASKLAKTPMAKSVLDAGWSSFRTMLHYKGDRAGCRVKDINEAYSTQECSQCHARTGPSGLQGLGIRQWTCPCGAQHDRDHNSAKVIRQRGLEEWEKEFSAAGEAKACESAANKGGGRCAPAQDPGSDMALWKQESPAYSCKG